MLLADPAELTSYVGTPVEETRASLFVELASAAIEDEVGFSLDQQTETITVRARGQRTILLPAFPVTAVDAVLFAGHEVDVEWTRAGELTIPSGWWGHGELTVTYTHGYATVPDGLKAVCLEIAARALVNPQALASFNSDGTVVQFAQRPVLGLTVDERDRVMRAIR